MTEEKKDKKLDSNQSASDNTDKRKDSFATADDFKKLLDTNKFKTPNEGDLIKGAVISASKAEVKIDIGGILTGVVRGPELCESDDDYADLQPGDEAQATVVELENENGELELSFKIAGQEQAWKGLYEALEKRKTIKVKATDANKGGVIVKYRQIAGFLPVSQLAPDNYPRVGGGDRSKILEKLRSFMGKEFEVKLITLDEKNDKIIFSEKEAWNDKQKDVISKYQTGTVVEGVISAITDFGVFINFGENLEGLIHISELAWQRIDNPANLYKTGDKIKAEVISLEGSKIFLSAKKLMKDPWQDIGNKYKSGQIAPGTILKVNPFGLFVQLDNDIHGLAHISQIGLAPKQRINEKFKAGQKANFEIVSMEPKEHRLGLVFVGEIDDKKQKEVKNAEKENDKENSRIGVAGKKTEELEKKKSKIVKKKDSEKESKDTEKKDTKTKKIKNVKTKDKVGKKK